MRHSPDEQGVSVTDLISAFLASATTEFASLVRDPADSWKVRVEEATPKGLVDVAPERVVFFFFASACFANARLAGRIIFVDREYVVDTVVGPTRVAAQYNLQEWAD